MAQHTPGPWRQNEHGNLVCYPDGLEVGILSSQLPKEEREANTRLIVAAPDLIEAMKGILSNPGGRCTADQWQAGLQAIAKAEGRS